MADKQVLAKFKKEKKKCARCRNHGLFIDLKGHKNYCRFASCSCKACDLLKKRQEIMRKSIAFRRRLDQAHMMGESIPSLPEDNDSECAEQPTSKQNFSIQGSQLQQTENGSQNIPYNPRYAFQQLDLGPSQFISNLQRQATYQGRSGVDPSFMQNGYPVPSQPRFSPVNDSACYPSMSPQGLTSGSKYGGEFPYQFGSPLQGSCQYDNMPYHGPQRIFTHPTFTTLRSIKQDNIAARTSYFPRSNASGFQIPNAYQPPSFADNQPSYMRTSPRPVLFRKIPLQSSVDQHMSGQQTTTNFQEEVLSSSSTESSDILTIDIENDSTINDRNDTSQDLVHH